MAATMVVTLPNAIRQSEDTWTKEVELSEMVGEDEDILADQTRDPSGQGTYLKTGAQRISDILSRCTVRIGTLTRPEGKDRFRLPDFFLSQWDSAYSNDRVYSMIRLRQLTMGNKFTFSENCPNCKKELKVITVELDKLEVKQIPLEEASQVTHEVTLPKSGDKVKWRFFAGPKDEEDIENIVKTMRSEFLSGLLYKRIVQVNGGKPAGGLLYLKRMSGMDRRFLSNHFDSAEGGIDTSIQIQCSFCAHEFTKKVEIMTGSFFFPSETPSPLNSTCALSPSAGDGVPTQLQESP